MITAAASHTTATGNWLASGPWVRFGLVTLAASLGGLVVFLSLVSISGAVVAPGSVGVEGSYKKIQHLDGGVVAKILVEDGQRVAAGDVLIELDATETQASLKVAKGRVADLKLQEARLTAERDSHEAFEAPDEIDKADPAIEKALANQRSLFAARRTSLLGEQSMLKERISQLEGEQEGLSSQLEAARKQREINAKELATVLPLFEKGYVNQQRLSPLERESARLDGEIGRLQAEIAKLKSAMSETGLKLAQNEKDYQSGVADELRKVTAQLAEQQEIEKAQSGRSARTQVRAPVAGRVHALAVHTIGGVVSPGGLIAEIIPDGERLLVDAEVLPQAIDRVHEGQTAMVRFPAFNAKRTPRLNGTVSRVSPAEIKDQQGRARFTVKVEIAPDELLRLGRGHALVPGMPAEVYIETDARSILSYLLKPLTDAMFGAFRE